MQIAAIRLRHFRKIYSLSVKILPDKRKFDFNVFLEIFTEDFCFKDMKIHTFTSIFGISQAAFYGNAYNNQYIGQSPYPRPGPNGLIPIHRPGPRTVPSTPVPKKQLHQGALCGKITDFRQDLKISSNTVCIRSPQKLIVHQKHGQNWTACSRKTFLWP